MVGQQTTPLGTFGRCSRHLTTFPLMLHDHPCNRQARDRQVPCDTALRLTATPALHNLISQFLVHGRAPSPQKKITPPGPPPGPGPDPPKTPPQPQRTHTPTPVPPPHP